MQPSVILYHEHYWSWCYRVKSRIIQLTSVSILCQVLLCFFLAVSTQLILFTIILICFALNYFQPSLCLLWYNSSAPLCAFLWIDGNQNSHLKRHGKGLSLATLLVSAILKNWLKKQHNQMPTCDKPVMCFQAHHLHAQSKSKQGKPPAAMWNVAIATHWTSAGTPVHYSALKLCAGKSSC